MLKSPFKFLGFSGRAKKPKPNPQIDSERKIKGSGKLRKVRHSAASANTSANIADRPSMEKGLKVDRSTAVTEGKHSGEHYQNQPAGPSLIGPPDIHNTSTDAVHPFLPHTQAYENNDPSSSIFADPGRNSSGGKKSRAQAPISGDYAPSVRRDSLGGGNSNQTHEWGGDHGGVQDWIVNTGLNYIQKRIMPPEGSTSFNADPHQHEAQEHHDENDNLKKASQQQNSETYSPIVSQANPLEKDENRARRENVSKHDHPEAAAHGDRIKGTSSFEPEIYYYMVPAGLDIIFQDEDGTEITRVGKTMKGAQHHASHAHTKNIPIVVQDILGNELFRSNLDQDDPSLGLPSPNHTPWKTIIVDEKGKQIPLKYAERNVG